MSHSDNSFQEKTGIIGGEVVRVGDSMAKHLGFILDTSRSEICTGTLIRKDVLLTAAHCVSIVPEGLTVIFDLSPLSSDSEAPLMKVKKSVIHPGYTGQADHKSVDLALVFLEEAAPEGYEPIELPSAVDLQSADLVQFFGYGKSALGENGEYGRLLQTRNFVSDVNEGFFEVDQANGKGICDGDSGGPAFLKAADRLQLVGVTKMTYDKNEKGSDTCLGVSQFTRVDKNLPWILQKL